MTLRSASFQGLWQHCGWVSGRCIQALRSRPQQSPPCTGHSWREHTTNASSFSEIHQASILGLWYLDCKPVSLFSTRYLAISFSGDRHPNSLEQNYLCVLFLIYFDNACFRACFQFGALAGLFYGVQKLSAVANAEKSLGDTVLAAGVTGSTAGMFCGSLSSKTLLWAWIMSSRPFHVCHEVPPFRFPRNQAPSQTVMLLSICSCWSSEQQVKRTS